MGMNKRLITEDLALENAKIFYTKLSSIEKHRHESPLQVLEKEESYFQESMILQTAAFELINNQFPFEEKSKYTYAACSLAFSTFDHLRRGWLCILEGYYRVAMTIVRHIFESIVFETAIGVGLSIEFKKVSDTRLENPIDKWLSEWWRGEFKFGTVQKLINLIEKEFNNRGTGGEIAWVKSARTLWKILSGWPHANWESMAQSGVFVSFKEENGIPALSFGGNLWNSNLCKTLGSLYAYTAVDATRAIGLAFVPQLANCQKWYKRNDCLNADYMKWYGKQDNHIL